MQAMLKGSGILESELKEDLTAAVKVVEFTNNRFAVRSRLRLSRSHDRHQLLASIRQWREVTPWWR